MKYQKYENEHYELLKYKNSIIIKDKDNLKYYETNDSNFCCDIQWDDYHSVISSNIYYVVIISSIILLVVNSYIAFIPQVKLNCGKALFLFLSLIYTFFNVVIHEIAHILMLRKCGKNFDKIGFKMNYIFPAIYVRMNDLYMLTKEEKIMVHIAGIYINLLINSILIFTGYFFKNSFFISITQFFAIGILMNMVPILNSDGYKILLALFYYNEKKVKIYNKFWIKLIGYFNLILCIYQLLKIILR